MSSAPNAHIRIKKRHSAYAAALPQSVEAGPRAESDRDALIEAHLPQVRFIAERLAARLPPSVDRDDLIGAGVIGLLSAVDKFDPSRDVQFKTYAEMRVRGAMLDCLRSLDWAPRSLRQRGREVEAAYRRIEAEQGRPAGEEEVAALLGLSLTQFQALLGELQGLTLLGLDGGGEEDGSPPQLPDDPARSPLAIYERADGRARLIRAIDSLPERERQVVALYYLEELTMKEVGEAMGVTESRVSQIHTQAVMRLRGALRGRTKPVSAEAEHGK
ncbi:MAG: FliA/WhiG family RNA polymerase sigma factor [Blastocatellia bacterium]|nr:FliA/WhiG family RNA polymerase sigma factor [Blastocatellia bacterium]